MLSGIPLVLFLTIYFVSDKLFSEVFNMKKFRIITALFLSLIIVVSLCSCSITLRDEFTTTTGPVSADEGDEWENYEEYDVEKYELENDAFKAEGELNLYKYEDLDDAQKVIDVFNSYYDADLKVDEDTQHDGYGNWFWDNGDDSDPVSASVSMSSKTGKFSFYYVPDMQVIKNASTLVSVDGDKWTDKVTEFVNKFEFVTGKLTLDGSVAYNDMYYPVFEEGNDDSQDVRVWGRRFFFVSEDYSKQKVLAQDGLECYVECGSSDIETRDVQYFVVTIFNDGTIVSADNYITKADIVSDGTQKMIDESFMDKLLEYFTSTKEDDTLIVKRIYIDSYSNYFGYAEITPVVKVEYCYKSDTDDVRTTEFALEGFYN